MLVAHDRGNNAGGRRGHETLGITTFEGGERGGEFGAFALNLLLADIVNRADRLRNADPHRYRLFAAVRA